MRQAAQHDEGEDGNKKHAENDAEFFRCNREDEVGMAIGNDALDDTLTRSATEPVATNDRFTRRVHLECVALTRPETVDTAGHVRQHEIGGDDAADAETPEHDDPEPRHTRHEEHAAPDNGGQDRLAEVRLGDEKCGHDSEGDDRKEIARNFRMTRPLCKKPCADDDESRLHEFRRLDRESADGNPPPRALHLDAEEQCKDHHQQRGDQHDDRHAAHLARRQEGQADHDCQRWHHEHGLTLNEKEAVEADTLGNGRRRREGQHQADAHQRDECRQKETVDGPEPFRDRTAINSAYHGLQPPFPE